MRPGTALSNNNLTNRNTRSLTPGIAVRANRLTSLNPDKFFQTENSRLPLFTPSLPTDSDKQEFTSQLKIIKKELNKTKIQWSYIESNLNKTKNEMIKIENSEKITQAKLKYMHDKLNFLENDQNRIQKEFAFALVDFNSFTHLKERTTLTLIFFEVKRNYLREQLRLRNGLLKDEERKKIKTAESYGRNIKKYRTLSMNYEFEDRKRVLLANQVDKDINNKQNFTTRREEMIKRRVEIAESVANEDKIQRNNFLREGMLIHKAWFKYLNSKLLKETQKFQSIEKAYASIRSLTGLSNIHEVVQKILTREHSYTSLMNMILENKKICEKYQQKNIELEKEMNDILVKGSNTVSNMEPQKNIAKLLKSISADKQRVVRLHATRSYISSWAKNFARKISPQEDFTEEKIFEVFCELKTLIKSKVKVFDRSNSKTTVELYPPTIRKKGLVSIDHVKTSDLMYTEEDIVDSLSPVDRNNKKRPTRILPKGIY